MMSRSMISFLLPVLLIACTTDEEKFANDANKLYSDGEQDLAQMCGYVGEIILERSNNYEVSQIQAQVANAHIVSEDSSAVEALARVKTGATGYLDSLIDIECRFDKSPAFDDRWHELLALKIAGNPFSEEELANVNEFTAALAGFKGQQSQ